MLILIPNKFRSACRRQACDYRWACTSGWL